ncbi:hypothetical protein OBBRIDRAFT_213898 [Obba rivulosa]|uniref:Uncharacterized protein n=1 Tax=Obba rivulosa TaxID=1052685 RepID=A0A8E2AL69_9APHY|nr:hypothetical protein OBBRIDRAFT_213898 [Obba rivulosa]
MHDTCEVWGNSSSCLTGTLVEDPGAQKVEDMWPRGSETAALSTKSGARFTAYLSSCAHAAVVSAMRTRVMRYNVAHPSISPKLPDPPIHRTSAFTCPALHRTTAVILGFQLKQTRGRINNCPRAGRPPSTCTMFSQAASSSEFPLADDGFQLSCPGRKLQMFGGGRYATSRNTSS